MLCLAAATPTIATRQHARRPGAAAAAAAARLPAAIRPASRRRPASVVTAASAAQTDDAAAAEADLASYPTPRGRRFSLPLLGETRGLLADHLAWVHDHVQRHGPVFRADVMGVKGAVVLTSWAAISRVMMGEPAITRWWMPPAFVELLGTASDPAVQTDKAKHAKRRRQQATAFTPAAMASYAPRVEAVARGSLARWAAAPGPVDLVDELSTTTFGFARTVVELGLDGDAEATLTQHWSTYVRNLMALPIDLPGTRLHKAKKAKRVILAAINGAVRRYLDAFNRGEAPPSTMLGYYMAARAADGDPLSADELGDMTLALLLAGHDTSHAGHTVLMATLPRLPAQLRARLADEQRGVVARHGDALTATALADMPLAEACVKECLRLLGAADNLWREAASTFVVDGVRVPAGSKLLCSILYAKASDPALIGPGGLPPDAALPPPHMDINALKPDAFDPDRWLGGTEPTGGVGTFGMGGRFCLGAPLFLQEAKCLVAAVTREYDLTLEGPHTWAPSWAAQVQLKAEIRLGVRRKAPADIICAAAVGKGGAAAGPALGGAAGVPPPAGAVDPSSAGVGAPAAAG